MTGQKVIQVDGKSIHSSCNSNELEAQISQMSLQSSEMSLQSFNRSFEDNLSEVGRLGYTLDTLLDEIRIEMKARFSDIHIFDANVDNVVKPLITRGFPLKTQDLMNGSLRAARLNNEEQERTNALAKLRRIVAKIRWHCYTGYPADTPQPQPQSNSDQDKEENDLIVPVAKAVSNVAVMVKADDSSTQDYDDVSIQNESENGKMQPIYVFKRN